MLIRHAQEGWWREDGELFTKSQGYSLENKKHLPNTHRRGGLLFNLIVEQKLKTSRPRVTLHAQTTLQHKSEVLFKTIFTHLVCYLLTVKWFQDRTGKQGRGMLWLNLTVYEFQPAVTTEKEERVYQQKKERARNGTSCKPEEKARQHGKCLANGGVRQKRPPSSAVDHIDYLWLFY